MQLNSRWDFDNSNTDDRWSSHRGSRRCGWQPPPHSNSKRAMLAHRKCHTHWLRCRHNHMCQHPCKCTNHRRNWQRDRNYKHSERCIRDTQMYSFHHLLLPRYCNFMRLNLYTQTVWHQHSRGQRQRHRSPRHIPLRHNKLDRCNTQKTNRSKHRS